MFPKTQDHTIDRLLRVQGGGSGKESQPCREFDADLANAYVEHSLTANETAGYEQHLAACSPCRKSIIALTRMAQADVVAARTGAAVERTRSESWAKRWLGALTAPQWAMAAAAAIVLAITLPLFLSQRTSPNHPPASINESAKPQAEANSPAPGLAQEIVPAAAASNSAADAAREPNTAGRVTAPTSEKSASVAETKKEAPAESPASSPDENSTPSGSSKLAESPPADQAAAKDVSKAQPGAPAAQPGTSDAPLPKIKEEDAKHLADDKGATTDTTLKPGQGGNGEERKAAETAVRPDSIAPPPPPPSRAAESGRARRRDEEAVSGPSASRFQPSREVVRAPRGASRKVNNHIFWLRGDIWTDKDYNPDKQTSLIQVIRDSDVYRDLLEKDGKLNPFFTGFPADARVIFVHKGKAYYLIPQDGNR